LSKAAPGANLATLRKHPTLAIAPCEGHSANLNDAQGQSRLRLRVTADGTASIEFLDAKGAVQRTFTPAAE